MRRRRDRRRAGAALVVALLLASCSGGGDGGGTPSPSCASDLRVGVAFGPGGLGDLARNDLANAGLQQAVADGLVCEANVRTVEPDPAGADLAADVRSVADRADLVIAVGPDLADAATAVAADLPDVAFVVVDAPASMPTTANLAAYRFRAEDGGFLVGAAAALKCRCDAIGFLGVRGDPDARAAEAGYAAGARAVREGVEVSSGSVAPTADASAVRAAAERLLDAGAEVLFVDAGAASGGAFAAAAARGAWAIGAGTDAYLTASDDVRSVLLTSMLRRLDAAVFEAIRTASTGAAITGERRFGLSENGVGYSTASPDLTTDIVGDLERLRQDVLTGEVVIPDAP